MKGRMRNYISLNLSQRKGITPIIATVMLLLIAIAIIALASSWFFSTTQYTMEETENATKTQAGKINADFRLEGSHSNQIYLRNLGEVFLTKDALSIFINNNRIPSEDITMNDIEPGKVGTLTIGTANEGDTVDIYGPITHITAVVGEITTTTIIVATCDAGDGCKPDCIAGDEDCACTEQDAYVDICEPVIESCSGDDLISLDDVICCNEACTIDSTIVGMWHFDGNALDSSGNGNDGTIVGATSATGKIAGAYYFDGINDYVELPDLAETPAGTISMWVKFNTLTDNYILGNSGIGNLDIAVYANPQLRFVIHDGIGWNTALAGNIQTNTWHYIVGVWNGIQITAYLDGVSGTAVDSGSPISKSSNWDLGRSSAPGFYSYFNGIIDEVVVWNRELDSTAVQELYDSQNS